jgi:hypothetical protein
MCACIAVALLASRAAAVEVGPAVARAQARLREALAHEAEAAKRPIKTGVAVGPLGGLVVTAAIEGAYPGTGVARTVVLRGTSWGARGEHDLADLARDSGWLERPPVDERAFAELVNAAQFDGLLALDEGHPPKLARGGGGLVLTLVRRRFPSGTMERLVVRLPPSGRATVVTDPVEPAPRSEKGGGDVLDEAEAAIASGTAAARAEAIRRLRGRNDARAMALLARATTLADQTLAADALLAIGARDDAAAALRRAWSALDARRRDALVAMAEEAYGAAFAAKLR